MVLVSYKPKNDISILQTKLRHREWYEARRIGLEAMPLDEHIEGGHGKRKSRMERRPDAMHDLLEVANDGQHRQDRLHEEAILPLPPLAQFEVGGIPLGGMESGITQDNHTSVELKNESLKGVICDIGGGTRPPHDQSPLIQQQTEFAPGNPAVVREAFAANLVGTPAFTHGVDQLDAVGVNDAEHRRSGQEDLRPVLMRPEEAKEPRALRKLRKQRPIVARQPAIKRTVAHAFEGMEQPQGDHLTRPEASLGVFGDGAQLVIDLREQGGDKVHGDHTALLAWEGCHTDQRGGVV